MEGFLFMPFFLIFASFQVKFFYRFLNSHHFFMNVPLSYKKFYPQMETFHIFRYIIFFWFRFFVFRSVFYVLLHIHRKNGYVPVSKKRMQPLVTEGFRQIHFPILYYIVLHCMYVN